MKITKKGNRGQEVNWLFGCLLIPYNDLELAPDYRANKAIQAFRYDKRNPANLCFTFEDLRRFLGLGYSTLRAIWNKIKKEQLTGALEATQGFYHLNPMAFKVLVPGQFKLYDYIAQQCNRSGGRYSFKISKLREKMDVVWLTIVRQLRVLIDRGLIRIVSNVKRGSTVIEMLPYSKAKEKEVLEKLKQKATEKTPEQQAKEDKETLKMLFDCVASPAQNQAKTNSSEQVKSNNPAPQSVANPRSRDTAPPPKTDAFFDEQSEEERAAVLKGLAEVMRTFYV